MVRTSVRGEGGRRRRWGREVYFSWWSCYSAGGGAAAGLGACLAAAVAAGVAGAAGGSVAAGDGDGVA
eukprot:3186500-Pyramimonas_sp.AAC.1